MLALGCIDDSPWVYAAICSLTTGNGSSIIGVFNRRNWKMPNERMNEQKNNMQCWTLGNVVLSFGKSWYLCSLGFNQSEGFRFGRTPHSVETDQKTQKTTHNSRNIHWVESLRGSMVGELPEEQWATTGRSTTQLLSQWFSYIIIQTDKLATENREKPITELKRKYLTLLQHPKYPFDYAQTLFSLLSPDLSLCERVTSPWCHGPIWTLAFCCLCFGLCFLNVPLVFPMSSCFECVMCTCVYSSRWTFPSCVITLCVSSVSCLEFPLSFVFFQLAPSGVSRLLVLFVCI